MVRFDMVMPVELIGRVDAQRGELSRAAWVRRAVGSVLVAQVRAEALPSAPVAHVARVVQQRRPAQSPAASLACPERGAVGRIHQRGCRRG